VITSERLNEIRALSKSSAPYPGSAWEAQRSALAGAVPELIETINQLLIVVATLRKPESEESE
jgi:hypothetical protein